MIVSFHNVTITIQNVESPEEAYRILVESFRRGNIRSYETDTYSTDKDGFESARDTNELVEG
jgi:hypothetical protein